MKKNVGKLDSMIRIALALVLVIVAFVSGVNSNFFIPLILLAIILVATASLNFCPLYLPFGFSTKK